MKSSAQFVLLYYTYLHAFSLLRFFSSEEGLSIDGLIPRPIWPPLRRENSLEMAFKHMFLFPMKWEEERSSFFTQTVNTTYTDASERATEFVEEIVRDDL